MERIWLKSYPKGVPAEIDVDSVASLAELMESACRRYSERVVYYSLGGRMSYAELEQKSRHFAAWLQGVGIARGARVALMMPNVLQYPVCLFGALRAGCVVVNCNPLYTARELEHQLKDSGAEVIVVVENFAQTVQQVLPQLALRHIVVTSLGELLGPLRGLMVNMVVRHVKKKVPAWSIPGAQSLSRTLTLGAAVGFEPVALNHADIAFLQYTGGTTGVAKGVILTHGNMVANVLQASAFVNSSLGEGQELVVTALPLYHIFALTANCLKFMHIGGGSLLIVNARDIADMVKEMSHHRFTAITGVNTLFNALVHNPEFARLDFSALRLALGGGMAVQQAVSDQWQKITGRPIVEAYGLTEASPAVTINPPDLKAYNGSIGLPIPSTEISIRDDAGSELPMRQVGELCVRGPQVTPGYWQQPDETAKVMYPDGFLRTGDLGYVDQLGYVFLVDRKKDMILVSGFNVYPNEIEAVVAMHPGVREVAAIGVPDEHSGEVPKIFVIRKDPTLTAEALIAYCRQQLTGYKVPHYVEFRDDLPRTNVGKILRRALKDEQPPGGSHS